MSESPLQLARAAEASAPPLPFFSELEKEANNRLAVEGEFTGERLLRDRPGVYAAVVRMAAEGLSISATARALGVSRNTVCAVRDREGITIEQDKRELLNDLRRASRLSVEKVIELLPTVKLAKDAAITAAVMIDKAELLSGGATSRVERVEVQADQVRAFLDALPVVEGEVIDADLIGVAGETSGQRAGGLDGGRELGAGACSDGATDVAQGGASVEVETWATLGTTPAAGEGAVDLGAEGGGGGAVCCDGVVGEIDSNLQNFGQRADRSEPGDLCERSKNKRGARKSCPETKSGKKKGGA